MRWNRGHLLVGFALSLGACSHKITSPAAGLASVAPDLVCNAASVSSASGATTVVLNGSGFTPMSSRTLNDPRRLLLPRVTLTASAAVPGAALPDAPVAIVDDPQSPAASRVHWTSEQKMSFDVVPTDNVPAGVYGVTVTNPDGSHAASLDQVLAVIPAPIVGMVKPAAICDDQGDQTLVITGANFLVYDGRTPSVNLGGASGKTYASTFQASDCMAIPGTFAEANPQLCATISIVVAQNDFEVGAATRVPLVVTNPPPADCSSSSSPIDVTIEPPPQVNSVVPATVCQGGSTVTINGEGFIAGATASLSCGATTVNTSSTTVNTDGTQLTATFGGGAVPGTCDLIVQNADGCEDRPLPHKTVHVTTGPVVFFVDPDVVFSGINTDVTIYATAVASTLESRGSVTIALTGQTGTATSLSFRRDPQHNNRVHATVPSGQAAGTYDLTLDDGGGCPATLTAAFKVTSTTDIAIAQVKAPFGFTGTDTAVEIFRDKTAAAPNDHPFLAVPRVFLNPHNASAGITATELKSVTFLDGDRLTGVVPKATAVGSYDVIVVDPDGTVGFLSYTLAAGYTETSVAPPRVDSATPSSIVDQAGQHVVLAGSGFGAGDVVSLACKAPTGTSLSPPVVAAAPACAAGACTQAITVDGSTLPMGSVCVARVTNTDGTFGEYSAIGVTGSSLNLNAPVKGPDLNVGRRALVAAAGNATATARFVYAIGGDDGGNPATAIDSIEVAPVDPFGAVGAFMLQPTPLPQRRSFASAVTIGRYIYVIGGSDGTGPLKSAVRAKILSPLEVPEVADLDVQLQDTGLDAGTYIYRISAVFGAGDTDNPSGESLASDEFTVRVPSFSGKKIALTLVWNAPVDSLGVALPNVAGYRVYRTKKAGDAPGTEVLLGSAAITTTGLTFVDDGTSAPATAVPLPLGSTGQWLALPALATARQGAAATFAADPTTPGTFYVYALLGRSAATVGNASYEYLPITVASNGRQTAAGTWVGGTLTSVAPRWQIGAWTVDQTIATSTAYAGKSFVYIGGGLTAAGASETKVEAGLVTTGGQLATTTATAPTHLDDKPKDFGAPQAGYGVCAANNQLFTFGGENALPMSGAKSAAFMDPPPSLTGSSWNDEGLTMTHGRYLLGSAVQSSFIFLLGGQTDEPSPASKSTELVIW